jgi:hypothetical protein
LFKDNSSKNVLNTDYIMICCRIEILNLRTLQLWMCTSKMKFRMLKTERITQIQDVSEHGGENVWTSEKEVTRSCRKICYEDLHNFYSSSNFINVTNQGRWDGWGIQHTQNMKNVYKILIIKPQRMDYLEDVGTDRRLMLKQILEK